MCIRYICYVRYVYIVCLTVCPAYNFKMKWSFSLIFGTLIYVDIIYVIFDGQRSSSQGKIHEESISGYTSTLWGETEKRFAEKQTCLETVR